MYATEPAWDQWWHSDQFSWVCPKPLSFLFPSEQEETRHGNEREVVIALLQLISDFGKLNI